MKCRACGEYSRPGTPLGLRAHADKCDVAEQEKRAAALLKRLAMRRLTNNWS